MKKENKFLKTLKIIGNIITWVVLTVLVGIIMFLVFVVVTTKVSEKNGGRPIFALYTIVSPSMVSTLNVYDVAFVAQTDTKKLEVGDIISFYVSSNSMLSVTPVTHRIISKTLVNDGTYAFNTKGDNNDAADEWTIYESDIIGKVIFKIPQLGKFQFFLTSKMGWFIVILIPALGIIAYDLFKILKLILLKGKINNERRENAYIEKADLNINNNNDQRILPSNENIVNNNSNIQNSTFTPNNENSQNEVNNDINDIYKM